MSLPPSKQYWRYFYPSFTNDNYYHFSIYFVSRSHFLLLTLIFHTKCYTYARLYTTGKQRIIIIIIQNEQCSPVESQVSKCRSIGLCKIPSGFTPSLCVSLKIISPCNIDRSFITHTNGSFTLWKLFRKIDFISVRIVLVELKLKIRQRRWFKFYIINNMTSWRCGSCASSMFHDQLPNTHQLARIRTYLIFRWWKWYFFKNHML